MLAVKNFLLHAVKSEKFLLSVGPYKSSWVPAYQKCSGVMASQHSFLKPTIKKIFPNALASKVSWNTYIKVYFKLTLGCLTLQSRLLTQTQVQYLLSNNAGLWKVFLSAGYSRVTASQNSSGVMAGQNHCKCRLAKKSSWVPAVKILLECWLINKIPKRWSVKSNRKCWPVKKVQSAGQ